MCDFNTLTDEQKKLHHEKLLSCANNFGGKNFFLQLLETIRESKQHPLIAGTMSFEIELGSIKWNKAIFNDKLQVLIKARKNESKQDNLLPNADEKNYIKIFIPKNLKSMKNIS